jgi:magnesium transporter
VHELVLAGLLAVPLGAAVALLSRMWGAPWTIGAAVGAAMAFNALVAIAIGGLCPLVLRRFAIDPALASGPISTTMADVSGFALTLTLVALAA